MKTKSVTVIMTRCNATGTHILGERVVDAKYSTLEEAQELGNQLRGQGYAVVVRPSYNENNAQGRFFREWRSFNGEDFKEVRFGF